MKNIDNLPKSSDYIKFLTDLKGRIHASQMRAALAANSELISLYWHIGKCICFFRRLLNLSHRSRDNYRGAIYALFSQKLKTNQLLNFT